MLKRVAEEKDVAEIVELANWSYRGRAGSVPSWNIESGLIAGPRTTAELLREELQSKAGGALLVFRETEDGPLIGTIWAHPLEGTTWHLSLLSVRPDRQAEGFGREFFQAGERYAAEHGARRIHLTVLSARTELQQWYARLGYQMTGATEPYPSGDPRSGRPLRDDLYFVVMERDV